MRLLLAALALLGLAPFMHAMPKGPNSGALMNAHGPPSPSNQKVNSPGSVPVTVRVKFPKPFGGEKFASPVSSIGSKKVEEAMSRLIATHKKMYQDQEDLNRLRVMPLEYVNEFSEPQDPSLSGFFKVHISGLFYPCFEPCYYQVPYDTRKMPRMYMVTAKDYEDGY
ncbi:hypothetical protein DFH05DRAFT_1477072 [Lentinula detonsa]|uniref:Uncharacterized protein n=1 Tax=Lentinula detonsa TaxID=2804962 RepID=A0A9W8U1W1_9AGAR|nr:hypothetical protein DFH05DRAFT_1477072 [Lentinula detonsa]KAJ3982510.1 hypothetical protein F5890DRAFT_359476 [Lentinula detonsa]